MQHERAISFSDRDFHRGAPGRFIALRGAGPWRDVIEVNPEITPLTGNARHSFHEPAGVVLPALLTAAWP